MGQSNLSANPAETNVLDDRSPHPEFRLNLEERIGHLLRRAYQRHVMVFQTHLHEFDLTTAQCVALANLLEYGQCSQSELARLTAIDHTSIRGIVSRLKKRDLLRAEVDPNDARKVNICLTAKGEKLIIKALERFDDVAEGTFNGISEDERAALKYLLKRVADISLEDTESFQAAASSAPAHDKNAPSEPGPGFKLRLEERIGYLLRRAYQRHVNIFQEYLSGFQLTAAQYIVLGTTLELGVCSQSDLARHTVIDHTTIRGIISRLGARGLLFTEVDADDARKVNVVLTQAGRTIAQEAYYRIDSVSEDTFNGISLAERVALKYLIRRIADIPIPQGPTADKQHLH